MIDSSSPPHEERSLISAASVKLSAEARARLYRMKDELALKKDDPLYTFLLALEYYHRLYDEIPSDIAAISDELCSTLRASRDRNHALPRVAHSEMTKAARTRITLSTNRQLIPLVHDLTRFVALLKADGVRQQVQISLRKETIRLISQTSERLSQENHATFDMLLQQEARRLTEWLMKLTNTRIFIGFSCMLIVMFSLLLSDSLRWRGLSTTLTQDDVRSEYRQRETAFYDQLNHKSRLLLQQHNATLPPGAKLNFPHS